MILITIQSRDRNRAIMHFICHITCFSIREKSLQKPFTNNHITSCLLRYCDFLSYFQYSQQNKSRMKIRESEQGICQKNYSHIPINTLVKLRTIHYLKETKKRDATLGDIPLWESNTYLKLKLYLLSASACLVSGALGP